MVSLRICSDIETIYFTKLPQHSLLSHATYPRTELCEKNLGEKNDNYDISLFALYHPFLAAQVFTTSMYYATQLIQYLDE